MDAYMHDFYCLSQITCSTISFKSYSDDINCSILFKLSFQIIISFDLTIFEDFETLDAEKVIKILFFRVLITMCESVSPLFVEHACGCSL